MENFRFKFKTETDYWNARSRGYIDQYDMVRVHVKSVDGESSVDYPIHSEEDYIKTMDELKNKSHLECSVYQSTHYYDVSEYE